MARPDDANWTENYCNQAYCPDSQVGFWTHLSRLARPYRVWRDVLIAYLPGDRFLVAKGFGRPVTRNGPAAGMLSLGLILTVADYSDTEAVAKAAREARDLGFDGASCVHPSSVSGVRSLSRH